MVEFVIGMGIAAVLMVAEYFLSVKLESPLWGGIIPLLLVIGMIYFFASGYCSADLKTILPAILLIALAFRDWGTGREKHKKNRRA